MSETGTIKHEKSTGIALKDRLALIISLCALLFTGLNFWWTNYRVVDHLQAWVNYAKVMHADGIGCGADSISIRLVYSNLGDRQALVRHPQIRFDRVGTSFTMHAEHYAESRPMPFILPVKEMELVFIRVPLSECIAWLSADTALQHANEAEVVMRVGFRGTDPRGKTHEPSWNGAVYTLKFIRSRGSHGPTGEQPTEWNDPGQWCLLPSTNLYGDGPLEVIFEN